MNNHLKTLLRDNYWEEILKEWKEKELYFKLEKLRKEIWREMMELLENWKV